MTSGQALYQEFTNIPFTTKQNVKYDMTIYDMTIYSVLYAMHSAIYVLYMRVMPNIIILDAYQCFIY